MTEQEFTTHVEVPIRVYFDVQPEEKATQTYPGCPANIEINDIIFELNDNTYATHVQAIKDWILEKHGEDLVREAWENIE
ncbi:MAG: hypothetical protein ACYTFW_00925 [Planctomycetota bacterium]|jgi:hypothetical protein